MSENPVNRARVTNGPFEGGSYAPATQPTDVRASGFSNGIQLQMPNVTSTNVNMARQNRGSNVQIPYSRVVPLHDRDRLNVNGSPSYEYDKLHGGELAWVHGRYTSLGTYAPSSLDYGSFGRKLPPAAELKRAYAKSQAVTMGSEHKWGVGYGAAANKLSRLASTDWVEAFTKATNARVHLHGSIAKTANRDQDSDIKFWSDQIKELKVATLLSGPDLAYALQSVAIGQKMQVQVPMMQGFNVMEMGPFLTTFGKSREAVEVAVKDTNVKTTVPRHLVSNLAQKALICELKTLGLFNWTPDGICLSKFESGPDAIVDAGFDAQMGQLFNIGVQGPCITKTWSNGDSDMQVLPGDRLFVLLVADVEYMLVKEDPDSTGVKVVAINADTTKLTSAQSFARTMGYDSNGEFVVNGDNYAEPFTPNAQDEAERASAKERQEDTELQAELNDYYDMDYVSSESQYCETLANRIIAGVGEDPAQYQEYTKAVNDYINTTGPDARNVTFGGTFRRLAMDVRNGKRVMQYATLKNFRYMKATSSFLSNRSHIGSYGQQYGGRCGLSIGFDESNWKGGAEFIVGGWCIGTVLDAAASRALGPNGIRTPPTSMAYNLNVDIEWWHGDRLHDAFCDVDRGFYKKLPKEGDENDREYMDTGFSLNVQLQGQPTLKMRVNEVYRTPQSFAAEVNAENLNNADFETLDKGDAPSSILYKSAFKRVVVDGFADFEGIVIQPDPAGANVDPKGLIKLFRDGRPFLTGQYKQQLGNVMSFFSEKKSERARALKQFLDTEPDCWDNRLWYEAKQNRKWANLPQEKSEDSDGEEVEEY